MKAIAVLFCALCTTSLLAQGPDMAWSGNYGGSTGDYFYGVNTTSDGGYVAAGFTTSYGLLGQFYLVKTNGTGVMEWFQHYGGSTGDGAAVVQQTTDGGYFVAGATSSFGAGSYDYWLIKTNSIGVTQWTRTFGGSEDDRAYSAFQTPDGGYILAGYVYSFGAGGQDIYVVKTDVAGDVEWARIYGGTGNEVTWSIKPTSDGGYVIGGFTSSSGAGSYDFWLIKTDDSGIAQWTRTFGGTSADYCYAVDQTSDGGYLLGGRTNSFGVGGDYYLVKTDADGDLEWARNFGGSGQDEARSVQQTADGGFVMAGYSNSYGAGSYDFWVVKTDPMGFMQWSRSYGGSEREELYAAMQTPDGGYALAGHTWSYGVGTPGSSNAFLVKTGPETRGEGFVTLIQQGPPDWAYRLHHTAGSVSRFVFTDFCPGTMPSVSGDAAANGWTATQFEDSIVFSGNRWLNSGALDVFMLSHPTCSDQISWSVGDSSGTVDGPLPVELLSFQAISLDQAIRVEFSTASELDNDHFEIWRATYPNGTFVLNTQLESQGNSATEQRYVYMDREVEVNREYWYFLADVDINGQRTEHRNLMASATVTESISPDDYTLSAFPNPFNPSTTISFVLPEASRVALRVYDLSGRVVEVLADGHHDAGAHELRFQGNNLPSGVYLARLNAGAVSRTQKLLLIK